MHGFTPLLIAFAHLALRFFYFAWPPRTFLSKFADSPVDVHRRAFIHASSPLPLPAPIEKLDRMLGHYHSPSLAFGPCVIFRFPVCTEGLVRLAGSQNPLFSQLKKWNRRPSRSTSCYRPSLSLAGRLPNIFHCHASWVSGPPGSIGSCAAGSLVHPPPPNHTLIGFSVYVASLDRVIERIQPAVPRIEQSPHRPPPISVLI